MHIIVKEAETLSKVYHQILSDINFYGSHRFNEYWNTDRLEIRAMSIITNPEDLSDISKFIPCSPESLNSYCEEMIYGTMDWAIYEDKQPYTYHARMVQNDQLKNAIAKLKEDKYSTQATITIRNPDDYLLHDAPCLTSISLSLTEDGLDVTHYFRSHDLYKAYFMNLYALIKLWSKVAKEEFNTQLSTVITYSNSLHVYQKDFPSFLSAVAKISGESYENCIIPAEDFFV